MIQPITDLTTSGSGTAAQRSAGKRYVVAFVNEAAGSGPKHRHIEAVRHALRPGEFELEVCSQPDELSTLTAELQQAGALRAVIAVGGDGTVGAVLNATCQGTPICVLPLGTENLLAKYLGMSARPERLCRLLEEGVTVNLDAGRANGRLFALMISAGFDAEVVRRVHEERAGNITRWAYLKPIWQAIRNYKYPQLRVDCDGSGEAECRVGRWVFAMNLPQYARNLPIAPGAVGTDGQLDWCVFGRGSLVDGLWYLWHVVWRWHHRLGSVQTFRAGTCRIEAVDPDVVVPYQLDGDLGGNLPVTVETVPGRMTVLVMPEVAERLGFIASASQTEVTC